MYSSQVEFFLGDLLSPRLTQFDPNLGGLNNYNLVMMLCS